MRERIMPLAVLTALVTCLVAPGAATARSCERFIVGEANSTAYPGLRLPARGTAVRSGCARLRRMARRLHDGTYPVPDSAQASAGAFGAGFAVRDVGLRWRCRLKHVGGSGPSYTVRCRRGASRLRWSTG